MPAGIDVYGLQVGEKKNRPQKLKKTVWVFPRIVGFSPNHPLKNRVLHYFHHAFWGKSLFSETPGLVG